MATPTRRARQQAILQIEATEWLSPHMLRLVAGGDGFEAFQDNEFTDKYVKIVFVKPDLGLTPPYDVAALRESLPADDWPVTRTYTVRWVDRESQRIAIDFVVHGEEGIAGPWAATAGVGDVLALSGAGGAYAPDPTADWHLFAGDEAALPAISAGLDALPPDATGVAYLETEDEREIRQIAAPEGLSLRWLCRGAAGTAPGLLADTIASEPWPAGRVQVFAHGERESMKGVRRTLKERGVGREQISLSGYWAYGRSEDRFQAEKREPIGKIPD
jgi:NADPH-dependent ferric siderophore reductase